MDIAAGFCIILLVDFDEAVADVVVVAVCALDPKSSSMPMIGILGNVDWPLFAFHAGACCGLR